MISGGKWTQRRARIFHAHIGYWQVATVPLADDGGSAGGNRVRDVAVAITAAAKARDKEATGLYILARFRHRRADARVYVTAALEDISGRNVFEQAGKRLCHSAMQAFFGRREDGLAYSFKHSSIQATNANAPEHAGAS